MNEKVPQVVNQVRQNEHVQTAEQAAADVMNAAVERVNRFRSFVSEKVSALPDINIKDPLVNARDRAQAELGRAAQFVKEKPGEIKDKAADFYDENEEVSTLR